MYVEKSKVESVQKISDNIFLIKVLSPSIALLAKPGQFCNIKVSENSFPLLRRPFSICDIEGDFLFFLFDIHGDGTKLISEKKPGESLELLGPLGNGFDYKEGYDTAVIVAGGLGVAPFPFLVKNLSSNKKVISLIGGRSKKNIVTKGLKNVLAATDDGSEGFHGTVVELLKREIKNISQNKFRIFACGPTPMLKALQNYCVENNYDCQISVECAMACGFGICQGCPIDPTNGESYLLVCKDGPVFEAKSVKL
ncbi:MAG: dihydroorotate dehydrogenase electron transfer subunit [Ignavibacteriales bacterium]|nr:MAG: dihydroorotate dehydrogenase electron transfer subunit [Ignavibacteriales bacterium]